MSESLIMSKKVWSTPLKNFKYIFSRYFFFFGGGVLKLNNVCTHCWGLGKRAVFHASTFDAEVVNAAVVLVWCHLVIDWLLITRNAVEVCFSLNHLPWQFVFKTIRKTNLVYKYYIFWKLLSYIHAQRQKGKHLEERWHIPLV